MRKQKGITIVSLVVTIIILIILAGVTINITLGERGIITISKQAKENIQLAQIEEQTKLNELYIQMISEGETGGGIAYDAIAKLAEFKKVIAEAITNNGVETREEDTAEKMAENIGIIKNTVNNNIECISTFESNGKQTNITGLENGKKYIISAAYYIDNCENQTPVVSNIEISNCELISSSNLLYECKRQAGIYRMGGAMKTFYITAEGENANITVTRTDTATNAYNYGFIAVYEV